MSHSAQVTLRNSWILNNRNIGIIVRFSAQVTVENSQISGARISGLSLWDSSVQATIRNSQIFGDNGSGVFAEDGISLDNLTTARIFNNTVRDNKGWGIIWYCDIRTECYPTNIKCSGNSVYNNGKGN